MIEKSQATTELWDGLKDVPDQAKRTIRGGRMSGKTDINPMWRWHKLTERFGPCGVGWKFEITKVERHDIESGDEVVLFVHVLLWYQADGWSEPVPGVGGSMLVSREKSGLYVDDDALKKATTDALGVAAKMIGLGSDVYSGNADWSKYSNAYKPSEHPPAPEARPERHFSSEEQKQKFEDIIIWMDSGDATEKQLAGMLARSAELQSMGQLTTRQQRKVFVECLIRTSEWDDAQAFLVRMQQNSWFTEKQVGGYMERVDAGRSGAE